MDKNFDALLKGAEKAALEVFKVGENFRNKYKKTSCRTLFENILQKFRNIGWNMWHELHFRHNHLDFCQANLEMSVTSMMRDETKISPPWKHTKANGVQQCLSTIAGNLKD